MKSSLLLEVFCIPLANTKGILLSRSPAKSSAGNSSIVVIGSLDDVSECKKIKNTLKVEKVYSSEFLLTGILRQELDYEKNYLDF